MGIQNFDTILMGFVECAYTDQSLLVADLGIDSLTFTGLIQDLEETYERKVPGANMARTVGELRAMFVGSEGV